MGFHNEQHEIATAYRDAGLSPLAVTLTGDKAPAVGGSWKPYQQRLATDAELSQWFRKPAGIGIVCGAVSGGLEVIDFDQPEVFEAWRSLVYEIVAYLPVIETAGGGYHVPYRCSEIAGNHKLASWEPPESWSQQTYSTRQGCYGRPVKATRIETRGQGGYIVAVGSPAEVHASGRPYAQVSGPPLPRIPTITPLARNMLWEAAAEFDCGKSESPKIAAAMRRLKGDRYQQAAANRPDGDVPPWCDFDARARWNDILEPHGWTDAGGGRWTRPGKTSGISASLGPNAEGVQVLTVFSSNCGALTPGSYGPFRAYSILEHGGNCKAAAKEIYKMGYGTRKAVAQ